MTRTIRNQFQLWTQVNYLKITKWRTPWGRKWNDPKWLGYWVAKSQIRKVSNSKATASSPVGGGESWHWDKMAMEKGFCWGPGCACPDTSHFGIGSSMCCRGHRWIVGLCWGYARQVLKSSCMIERIKGNNKYPFNNSTEFKAIVWIFPHIKQGPEKDKFQP